MHDLSERYELTGTLLPDWQSVAVCQWLDRLTQYELERHPRRNVWAVRRYYPAIPGADGSGKPYEFFLIGN